MRVNPTPARRGAGAVAGHFELGGLFPRPPPEGFPEVLGALLGADFPPPPELLPAPLFPPP